MADFPFSGDRIVGRSRKRARIARGSDEPEASGDIVPRLSVESRIWHGVGSLGCAGAATLVLRLFSPWAPDVYGWAVAVCLAIVGLGLLVVAVWGWKPPLLRDFIHAVVESIR